MIIDIHHHLVCEKGYVELLLKQMDCLDIELTGLIAMGQLFEALMVRGEPIGALDESHLQRILKAHPDRFFGYIFVRPGVDGPEKIRRWAREGLSAVKFHIPRARYDHEAFLPLYGTAEELGLPCLFHSGIFRFPAMKEERISSAHTRPVYLDTIANEFLDLKTVIAHMGGVWSEEACGVARTYPNVYMDMSGYLDGWRSSKSLEWFKSRLYWKEAPDKLMFGSDVHAEELKPTLRDHLRIVRGMDWSKENERKFLSANARGLFNLP